MLRHCERQVILTCYALFLGTGSTASMLKPLVTFGELARASVMAFPSPGRGGGGGLAVILPAG